MSKIGLVTDLYKSDEVLEDFIKSISNQSYKNYHLYIVDNSPSIVTENLINNLTLQFPITGVTHIKNSSNVGVAKGNNIGIELAIANKADYIILLNNDIQFPQANLFLDLVNTAVDRNEHLIIPKIFYFGSRKIWLAGGKMYNFRGYGSHFGYNEDDDERFNKDKYFNYAPTCFMLISRKVFEKIGYMDEKYFVYSDDTDFILRAIRAGFKIFYLHHLEVFHKVSFSTGGGESLFSIYYLNRNRIYFIRKNYSAPIKQFSLIYTVITRFIHLLNYNPKNRNELIRAIKDGFSMIINKK